MTRTVLITGATDGLGRALAEHLAHRGMRVLIHGRDERRVASVCSQISRVSGNKVHGFVADFRNLSQVAHLGSQIRLHQADLEAIIHNAGEGFDGAAVRTADGYESRLQVNCLAPVLLTRCLLPLLSQRPLARVIHVVSAAQWPLNLDDISSERDWSGVKAYGRSKLAQLMSSFDDAEELANKVAVNAIHPASLMPTKLVLGKLPPQDSLETGVANVARLLELPQTASGRYYNMGQEDRAHSQAYDAQARAVLRAWIVENVLQPWTVN